MLIMIYWIIISLVLIAVVIGYRLKGEPFIAVPKVSTFSQCAKSCKEVVNCYGFVLDMNNKCLIYGHKITDKDNRIPVDIVCNKVQPINKFKFNENMSRINKLKNAIYDCKSKDRYIQVFSNGNKVTNITGLVNYGLNNTLKDYEMMNIGIID